MTAAKSPTHDWHWLKMTPTKPFEHYRALPSPIPAIQLCEVIGHGSTATAYKARAFLGDPSAGELTVKVVSITGPKSMECKKRLDHEFKVYEKIEEVRQKRESDVLMVPKCYGYYKSDSDGTYALMLSYEGTQLLGESWHDYRLNGREK